MIRHEAIHLIFVALVCVITFGRNRDWRLIVVALFFGFFIDIDHLFDYFIHFGFQINLSNFFDVSTYIIPGESVFVFLHGWEYILVWLFFGRFLEYKLKIKYLTLTIVLAYFLHLLWDNFSFHHNPWAYFITFRILHNFSQLSFNTI